MAKNDGPPKVLASHMDVYGHGYRLVQATKRAELHVTTELVPEAWYALIRVATEEDEERYKRINKARKEMGNE